MEAALRQAFRTQPEALALVAQERERRASAMAEDEDGTAEGLFPQPLAAHRRQAIDTCAEIDGLGGEHEATLRGELEHQGVSKKVRTNVTNWGCGSW
jgi:hypothetical protein